MVAQGEQNLVAVTADRDCWDAQTVEGTMEAAFQQLHRLLLCPKYNHPDTLATEKNGRVISQHKMASVNTCCKLAVWH